MKSILIALGCIGIWVVAAVNCNAQAIELKPAPVNIVIDGSLIEWSKELPYSDRKNTFNYLISNDHNNLYLIVKTKDTVCQGNILGAGITFAVDANDKDGPKLTFPLRGKEDPSEYMNLDTVQVAMKTILARYKRIGVKNFKNIKAEQLSTTNPYGIKVAIGYADGYMVYEETIPLKLLYPDGVNGKYAYSIKINGLARKVFYFGQGTMVPGGKKNRQQQIDDWLLQTYHGSMRINGPMPKADYDDKLTSDTEIKGEFILAK